MNVLVKFTAIGTDAGPFSLFSDVNGYVTSFESNITAAQLIAGYSSSNCPDGTAVVRVKSFGTCRNYVDLIIPGATTTTTTLPTTTTTTTTLPPTTTTTSTTAAPTTTTTTTVVVHSFLFDPSGGANGAAGCAKNSFTLTLYSTSATLIAPATVYTNSSLTTPFVGGGMWYRRDNGNIYSFNNTGQQQGFAVCTTTTTTTT